MMVVFVARENTPAPNKWLSLVALEFVHKNAMFDQSFEIIAAVLVSVCFIFEMHTFD